MSTIVSPIGWDRYTVERRCSGPMCGEPAVFQFTYTIERKNGRSAGLRNYCEKHAAAFAKKRGVALPPARPRAGEGEP